jgi:hypothetical protein
MFYGKPVVILREAVKRGPKNLARLLEEKTMREFLRSARNNKDMWRKGRG